jgi:hypothetical protein
LTLNEKELKKKILVNALLSNLIINILFYFLKVNENLLPNTSLEKVQETDLLVK